MTIRPKHQRLVLVALALAGLIGAVLLAMWGLKDRAAYFYTPSDIGRAAPNRAMRLGGMVDKGSLTHDPDGVTVRFTVSDGVARVPVTYRGIVPDLFRECSGVVAEGRMERGTFVAYNILAKHDERYMPPQMGILAAEHRAAKTLKR
jgi:cytochrome c-type biogenesis protein CcmE